MRRCGACRWWKTPRAALCAGLCLSVCVQMLPAHAQDRHAPIVSAPGDSTANLRQQRAQVRQQQAALRERLAALQQDIAVQDAQRRDVSLALKTSESAISALNRELRELRQQSETVQADLARMRADIPRQTEVLAQRRQILAEQLRAQYVGGLSPWTALLGGADPHAIGRNLRYFGYLSKAQTEAVRSVQNALADLQHLRVQTQDRQQELDVLRATTQARAQALQAQQRAQQQQLRQLETGLRARRTQADALQRDVLGLESLVSRLEVEIARQEEIAQTTELVHGSDGLRGLGDLQAKLPYPTPGEIHGRFGAQRPEGGLWRGVVIRAAQGAPVHAVAPGRVVYANWLTGFGNLMIVDHGAQYLTIYAYNQSLLRAVGDVVGEGETLALVGSTGGQVEPGLYFEIRYQGAPVNPQLWLRP